MKRSVKRTLATLNALVLTSAMSAQAGTGYLWVGECRRLDPAIYGFMWGIDFRVKGGDQIWGPSLPACSGEVLPGGYNMDPITIGQCPDMLWPGGERPASWAPARKSGMRSTSSPSSK